jgi:DNA-binding LacI/PurR family transcriptional regulator
MSSKVTIRTVARQAGVSVQTVSNVVNAPHLVRPETREHVQAVIDRLGYRASQAARQMRSGRSRLIGVRIEPARDGINGNILDRFLHELTEAAARAEFRIVLYTAADDAAEIQAYEDLLAAYSPDGFVLTSTHPDDPRPGWLLEKGVPFVTFGRPWGGPDRHPWVDVDGAAGTAAATEHLVAAGHRRIGFLGWPEGAGVADDRRNGWLSAMRAAGLDPTGLERHVDDGVAAGERTAAEMLAEPDGPTALVCASDSLALGAWNYVLATTGHYASSATARPARSVGPARPARSVGPARPAGSVGAARTAGTAGAATNTRSRSPSGASRAARPAVIGFDDTPVARAVGLTTVAQPLTEVAQACIRLLTAALNGGGGSSPEHVLLTPHLVVRDSA